MSHLRWKRRTKVMMIKLLDRKRLANTKYNNEIPTVTTNSDI